MALQDTTKTTEPAADGGDAGGAAKPAAAPVAGKPAAATPPAPAAAPPAGDPPAADPAKDAKAKPAAEKPATTSIFDDEDEEGGATDAPAKAAADGDADGEGEAEPEKPGSAWPDDWREKIAGADEKLLGELKRYASFDNWAKAQRALRQKMSSGEFKKAEPFDESWDDTRKAAWRKEQGVPEKPTDYKVPEVTGVEWSDADKAAMSPFLERMHARNASPGVVEEALSWYAEAKQMADEHRTNTDRQHKVELEDGLRSEWGNDYRPNVTLMKRLLGDAEVIPPDMSKALATARLPDGRRLINVPGVAQYLASTARSHYGEGALIPQSETIALDARETEIRKVMATDIQRYYREKDAAGRTMEQELREIMQRKEKAAPRR